MGLISLDYIIERVSDAFKVSKRIILGQSRKDEFVLPRHAFCLVAMSHGHNSVRIGKYLGRDHSTVLHGARRANERMIIDKDFQEIINKISEDLKNFYYVGENEPVTQSQVFDIAAELDDMGRQAIRLANRLKRGQYGISAGVREVVEDVSAATGQPEIPSIQRVDEANQGNSPGNNPDGCPGIRFVLQDTKT